MTLFFAFFVLPILDQSIGIDTTNVPKEDAKIVGEEFYYRFVTYVWTYVQVALVVWGAYAVTTGKLESFWEWLGFILEFLARQWRYRNYRGS